MEAYYLNTTDLEWYQWDEGCLSWEFPGSNHCVEWGSAYKMLVDGECTHWDSIAGYQINSFGVWVETWGDGVNNGEYEWDDGNSEDGDGCSSLWEVEYGFYCEDVLGWKEIVQPTAVVSKVDVNNICTIAFSEEVSITDYEEFSKTLKAIITGPSAPYDFKHKIYNPSSDLIESKTISSFQIMIYDIK